MRTVGTYKRIDSAGTYMNNMDGFVVPLYQRDKKIAFQSHYKFTIAAESMRFPGFVTEKIVHAFCAHTIPIYLGDPLVTRTFNSRAFINAGDFNSAEELIKEIERIDNDDSVFVEMLCEPKFSQDGYFWNTISEYERFLQSIFSQDSSAALRRQSSFDGGNYELKRTYPNISLIRKVYHKMRSLIRKK